MNWFAYAVIWGVGLQYSADLEWFCDPHKKVKNQWEKTDFVNQVGSEKVWAKDLRETSMCVFPLGKSTCEADRVGLEVRKGAWKNWLKLTSCQMPLEKPV